MRIPGYDRFIQIAIAAMAVIQFPVQGQNIMATMRNLEDFKSDMRFVGAPEVNGNRSSGLQGSYYLKDSFVPGEIDMDNGDVFTGIPLRFNVFLNEIEVKTADGHIFYLSNKEVVTRISIGDTVLVYSKYRDDVESQGYLILLHQGKCQIFQKNTKYLKEGTPSNGIVPATAPSITDKPTVYLIGFQGVVPQLIRNKKELLQLFGEKNQAMDDFIRQQHLNIRKGQDLQKLAAYFESL
jgi:hypothetical protein